LATWAFCITTGDACLVVEDRVSLAAADDGSSDFAAKRPRSRYCPLLRDNEGMLNRSKTQRETHHFLKKKPPKLTDADAESNDSPDAKMPAWKGRI